MSESERALLCKMWQGKEDMSALSTGNRGFKETYVYLSTCLPVDLTTRLPVSRLHVDLSTCRPVDLSMVLTFKAFRFKTRRIGACITVQDVAR